MRSLYCRANRLVKLLVSVFLPIVCWCALSVNAAEVEGFMQAQFGAHEQVVIEAIKTDFGEAQKIRILPEDPRTGAKTIEVELAEFKPIDAPAVISYILGYKHKHLIQVSVVWRLPKNITSSQRNQALVGISSMVQKFAKRSWTGGDVLLGRVSDEIKEGQTTNYLFFRGVAADDSAITVWGAPVTIVKNEAAKNIQKGADLSLTANIDKLEILGVNYELNVKRPDLKRITSQGF